MKKYIEQSISFVCIFAASMILLLSPGCKSSQSIVGGKDNLEKSTLWKISGEGLQESYLFGTIHIIPRSNFSLSEVDKTAFQACEQLILELDMDDPMMLFQMMAVMQMEDGQSMEDFLTKEEQKMVENALAKSQLPFPFELVKSMKPIMLTALLAEGMMDEPSTSFEEEFMAMATEKEINIEGLESVQDQMSALDAVPYEEQMQEIIESLKQQDESTAEFDSMIKLYMEEDIQALYDYSVQELDEQARTSMLDNRNRNWIEAILQFAKKKPSFFAVGAGHLAGDQGVINLLREAGIRVEAMP